VKDRDHHCAQPIIAPIFYKIPWHRKGQLLVFYNTKREEVECFGGKVFAGQKQCLT